MMTSMALEEVEKPDAEGPRVSTDVVAAAARTMSSPVNDHRARLEEPKLEALQGVIGSTDFLMLSRFVRRRLTELVRRTRPSKKVSMVGQRRLLPRCWGCQRREHCWARKCRRILDIARPKTCPFPEIMKN